MELTKLLPKNWTQFTNKVSTTALHLRRAFVKSLKFVFVSGILSHSDLDSRALDALKEFNGEGGTAVLQEFRESNLEHVSNKSAYLCGVMKTYR